MNKKLLITLIVLVLSIFAIYFFRANWGIDFADAFMVNAQSDNVVVTGEMISDANAVKNIVRVENIANNSLNLYFQPITDNSFISSLNLYAQKDKLTLSSIYTYRFASEEYNLIVNRLATMGLAVLFIMFIYMGAELRGVDFKRWQVGYYIVSDFILSVAIMIIVLGVLSVFGQLGFKMDNPLLTFMMANLGINLLYRVYEIEIIKRTKSTDKKDLLGVFKNRKPEIILLSCVLSLVILLPFMVLGGQMSVLSLLILTTLGLNYLTTIHLKPGFINFMFEQGEKMGMLKNKIFNKEW